MREDCAAGCCPHETCLPGSGPAAEGCPPDLPGAPLPERVAHLYACRQLSTYQIARITGISRQRGGRILRQAGIAVKPRGAGRPKARPGGQSPDPGELMADLYLRLRLSSTQIADMTGIPARTIRDRLRASGVLMRSRGRCNREDRTVIDLDKLAELYLRAGLSADEVGQALGVSRLVVLRSAHDEGLPVRIGGTPPRRGPSEIELIRALYADRLVRRALAGHGVPPVPQPGPIWQRFPQPHPLAADLAADLYIACGLGLHHIELVTGQPSATVGRLLHASEIPVRAAGGRSPFLRRWRAGG